MSKIKKSVIARSFAPKQPRNYPPHCHAELVSASHDKGDKIPKQVRDDSIGLSWVASPPARVPLTLLAMTIWVLPLYSDDTPPLPHQTWSFEGPLGTYNRTELQRGFQVYQQVCATCHGLKHLKYRDLAGLGYTPEEIKAIAAEQKVATLNEEGEETERPALPTDAIAGPYKNDNAARAANNGSLPPDLSLITKARAGGPDYVYALLTGYGAPSPKDLQLGEGMYYNPYFPGGQIAMTPPLSEGLITYDNGQKPSVKQMAKDVTAFLSWAAEPELEERKRMGYRVLIYLVVFTALMYVVMKTIWARVT